MGYSSTSEWASQLPQGHVSNNKRAVIAFVGTSFDFSDRTIQFLSEELDNIDVIRLERLSEVTRVAKHEAYDLRLIIVAQSRSDDLLSRTATYREAAGNGCLVLAYDDTSAAKRFRKAFINAPDTPCLRFLPLRSSIDGLVSYVRVLLMREWVVPEELIDHDWNPMTQNRPCESKPGSEVIEKDPVPSPRLTVRECEVLVRVSEGHRNKTIAHQLGLSEHTVKLHLHNIFGKLGVDNRSRATAWYLANADQIAEQRMLPK